MILKEGFSCLYCRIVRIVTFYKITKLAKQILKSTFKKLSKYPEKFQLVDEVFQEQLKLGIIEQVDDLAVFREEHPEASFLAHMPIFKFHKESTKCRVVYLSNLAEQGRDSKISFSHNQCMLAGPCLNQKVSTALIQLRFDKKLLCFDLVKAFLSIALLLIDQLKLCFLWYRNVAKGDYTLVGYKFKRLSFGLKCSPSLLLLGLYKILMEDTDKDSLKVRNLKKHLFNNFYMDNGCVTGSNTDDLLWAYHQLEVIFGPYKFSLQQFYSNDPVLQNEISKNCSVTFQPTVNLLRLNYNCLTDTLSTRKLCLSAEAATKREILSSLASNYDLYGFCGPLLNRARLFIHESQCSKSLDWNTRLPSEKLRTWRNIAKQVNSSPVIEVDRFVGDRDSSYSLIAYTDSSKFIMGTVLYIQDLKSQKQTFLRAKNRLINKQLQSKTIPTLELKAITLGVDTLIDLYTELAGCTATVPIKRVELKLYSDSLVCLGWIHSYFNLFDKMS